MELRLLQQREKRLWWVTNSNQVDWLFHIGYWPSGFPFLSTEGNDFQLHQEELRLEKIRKTFQMLRVIEYWVLKRATASPFGNGSRGWQILSIQAFLRSSLSGGHNKMSKMIALKSLPALFVVLKAPLTEAKGFLGGTSDKESAC